MRVSEAIKRASKAWSSKSATSPRDPSLPFQTLANPKDHSGVNALQVRSAKAIPEIATNEVMDKEDTKKEETNPKKGEGKPSRNERKAARKALPEYGYTPPLPYPTSMYKERLENECGGFMEILRNLHLNIPFL
ncbi:unnamed protein product [Linum trigynum]|uniref:Uncharacterized protein n=1 Tax=Linum trigynum TaxID=586398 RepID=A0AAV2E8U7_9ROSI